MSFLPDPGEHLRALEERIQELETENARLVSQNQALSTVLVESEAWFRAFIETIPHNVYAKDPEGRFIIVNPQYCQTQGKKASEILGKTDFDLYPSELAQKYRSDDRVVMQAGHVISRIESQQALDGKIRQLQIVKAPIYNAAGSVQGLLGVFWDISETLQQQEEIQAQALKLRIEEEKRRVLANFIRDAVHEFASPLSIIKARLYFLGRKEAASYPKMLQNIEVQVSWIQDLLNRLLILARLDTLLELERRPIRLETLFVGLFSVPMIDGKRINYRIDPTIGSVRLAPGDFAQALQELYQNALQYSRDKGRVEIRAWLQEEQLWISVQDDGAGIPDEILPHIFERFFRADKAELSRGLGLGLSIAKRIIDLHGGQLQVETEPNIGSRFTIILPSSALEQA